jgi:hypothetical protein
MKATIYKSEHATAELTNESPPSSYGIPVLRITLKTPREAPDHGPRDALVSGVFAIALVTSYRDGADLTARGWGGRWIKSKVGDALAERFIHSSPPAPRSLADVLHEGATFPSSWLSDEANRALDGEEPEK